MKLITRVIGNRSISRHAVHFSSFPVEPISFLNSFAIDENGNRIPNGFRIDRTNDGPLILESKNPHEMDKRITFNEDTHEYYLDGKLLDNTCTGLVNSFFEEFDADAIITKMMTGDNWPRKGYQYPNGNPYKPEEIKRQWKRTKEYASNYGTWMHYNIERYFNSLPPSDKLSEMKQFYEFEKVWIAGQGVTPFRTEWRIASPELRLGGTVDFIGQKSDGSFVIIDWKRSLKLESNLTNNYGKTARSPIEHMDDCDGSKYFLQLNLYRHILKTTYGLNVSSMVLASFHEKLAHYLAIEVPVMDYEVKRMVHGDETGEDISTSSE